MGPPIAVPGLRTWCAQGAAQHISKARTVVRILPDFPNVARVLCATSAIIVAGGASVGSAGAPAHQAGTRAELGSQYKRYYRMLKAKDVAGLLSLTCPDFVYVRDGIQWPRKLFGGMMKRKLGSVSSLPEYAVRIVSVNRKDGDVVVTTQTKSSASCRDTTGTVKTVTDVYSTVDTWSRTAKGWKLRRMEDNTPSFILAQKRRSETMRKRPGGSASEKKPQR